MKKIILLLGICFLTNTLTYAQSNELKSKFLNDSLSIITKRVENSIMKGRYMEQKLISTTDTLKNWEGVKVSLYEYKFGKNTARVYMANASSKKIATWVITTCVELTGKLDYKNSKLIISKINEASNGQFPVKGIVYEDGDYPYIFKDGVTVSLNKQTNNDLILINDDNIKETKKFGRIISTTRLEYNKLFPQINTSGHEWRKVVREEYIKALNSETNNLILAWAKGRIK